MSTTNISYSSELITNYLQAEVVAPYQKFQALQTDDGHSLLFSVGTDHELYLTEEILGKTTGWKKNDISAPLRDNFADASSVSVKTFAASQNQVNGGFCLLLALTVDTVDHLFIATSYTRSEEDDITVDWTEMTYDNPSQAVGSLNISDIYLMDTPSDPLIVVDVTAADGDIGRYYIDARDTLGMGYKWIFYNLPVDMAPNTPATPVTICAGRKAGDRWVNGLYTLGTIAGTPSITYQPLFKSSDPSQPGLISNLMLPNGVVPASIASAPSVGTPPTTSGADQATFTDLYVTATNGDLYLFAADNQGNLAEAIFIMNNPLFAEMNQLFAYTTHEKVTIWGCNRGQQVFYTQCAIDNHAYWGEWSYPLPIGEEVQQISPYVNRVNGGNTYFAHVGEDQLKKAFQDPNTSIWKVQDILLPSTSDDDVQAFDSYTTKVIFKDETDAPIPNAPVMVSSAYRIPVYVNNHYYVLDTTPISIDASATGALTIIQKVDDDMQGAILSIQAESEGIGVGGALVINPMDNATAKTLELDTADGLAAAEVTDDKGNATGTLVPADTSDSDLDAAANSISTLSTANDDLTTTDPATMAKVDRKIRLSRVSFKSDQPTYKVGEREVAAGDLFNLLKSTAQDYVIEIRERLSEAGHKIWDFVCTIGGEILTFVIDTVEKVVGAIQSVFKAIGTVIRGLIQFVKFLFSWDDIKQTQLVLSNVTKVLMNDALAALKQGDFRNQLNEMIDNLQVALNNFADISDDIPCPTIDEMSTEASEPTEDTSATDDFLVYHYTNNSGNATTTSSAEDLSTIESLFEALKEAIEAQRDIISDAINTFYTEILEDWQFRHLSLWEVLKKTLVIITDMIIDSAQNILNTLFDLLLALADGIWEYLNSPVWIPILSHILEEFFDYELPSWLDVVMLVAAMPTTMIYKVMRQQAPFPIGDPTTDQLVAATTMAEVTDIVQGNNLAKMKGANAKEETGPTWVQETLFIVGRIVTAFNDAISATLVIPASLSGVKGMGNVAPIQVSNMVNILTRLVVDNAVRHWANPAPIRNEKIATAAASLGHIHVAEKMIFTGIVIGSSNNTSAYLMFDSVLDFLLGGFSAIIATEHVYELIADDQFQDTTAQASLALTQCGVEFLTLGTGGMGAMLKFVPRTNVGFILVGGGVSALISGISAILREGESVSAAVLAAID